MIDNQTLRKIKQSVYNLLKNESTGHDYFHIERVVNATKAIGSNEDCDLSYAILLAYLHDVGDYKLYGGKDRTTEVITEILHPFELSPDFIKQTISDVNLVGYKGGLNKQTDKIEVLIVQDADRLDAMGAIGIARAFAYGGSKGRLLHDPNYKAKSYDSIEEYKNTQAPTIQHFYDKLLMLKDLMNTTTGKSLAAERHRFMELYIGHFYKEWEG